MPAVSPYESKGLQHLELKELAQVLIGHLKSGLHSFNNFSDMLLRVNADIVLPGCHTFHDIRQEIDNMKQQMKKSDLVAEKELQRLDGETVTLIAEQSNLVNQRKQRESELKKLITQLESHWFSLENYRKALEKEKRKLKSAEDTLDSMRQKRDSAQTVRDVGMGLMFIPFLGTITGAIMVGVGQRQMNQACDAVYGARKDIQSSIYWVDSYHDKVSKYRSLVDEAMHDIKEAGNTIFETVAKLRDVSVKREVVADVQAKVRRTVHQLGLLCGVGSVAELQTRRLILLEPVMKVMEEMTTALGRITGDDLLHTEGITSLMWDMKKNQNKLRQLADTRDTGLDNEYY